MFGLGAYLLWGVFPLYFPLLRPAGTVEILAWRIVWSLAVVLVLLWATRGFGRLRAALRDRRQVAALAIAAVLIAINWGTYVYGVNSGHVVEASLGYFVTPIVSILLGVFVLGERLRVAQWAAVVIGAVAVMIIAIDYGRPPWIALILAVSFGCYGYFKNQTSVTPVDSMAIETGVLLVPAAVALAVIAGSGGMAFGSYGVGNALIIAASGLVTAVPLMLFAAAARRLPLSVIGLLQYLAPVLQFAVGVGIRHESVPVAEFVGFCLVWVALAVLTVDGLRQQRRVPPQRSVPVEEPV